MCLSACYEQLYYKAISRKQKCSFEEFPFIGLEWVNGSELHGHQKTVRYYIHCNVTVRNAFWNFLWTLAGFYFAYYYINALTSFLIKRLKVFRVSSISKVTSSLQESTNAHDNSISTWSSQIVKITASALESCLWITAYFSVKSSCKAEWRN